jgi:hypothetical protein
VELKRFDSLKQDSEIIIFQHKIDEDVAEADLRWRKPAGVLNRRCLSQRENTRIRIDGNRSGYALLLRTREILVVVLPG